MAVVAIGAVVDVSVDAAMIGIGLCFLMAVGTRKDKIVAWIRVARGANAIGSAMIGWEPGVIKGRSQPTGGVVARGAGGWEAS